jgi:energy-coupling factor transporter ATP-binding protein EcfA2
MSLRLKAVQEQEFRQCQVLALMGEKGIGKSTFQALLTKVLGGKGGEAKNWILEGGSFHDTLINACHIYVDDPTLSHRMVKTSIDDRLKAIATSEQHFLNPKGVTAVQFPVIWACTLSMNLNPENIAVLPNQTEDGSDDKLAMILCSKTTPMGGNGKFPECLAKEIKTFRRYLEEWEIPNNIKNDRYGVATFRSGLSEALQYQNSEKGEMLLQTLGEVAPLENLKAAEIYKILSMRFGKRFTALFPEPKSLSRGLGKAIEFNAGSLFDLRVERVAGKGHTYLYSVTDLNKEEEDLMAVFE